MADSGVIREFLVALGFKVDEKGLKKFKAGVDDATKGVVRMVGTIQGAALAIGAGVSAFASKLEALYFVSQRTGAAATSLKALEYAAKNLGVSSQAAFGTVENLAKFLRNNPGSEGYLAGIGVQTRDANGQLRDTVDILSDLGAELAKKPTWLASQYGNTLGIDENLLLAMRNGDFAKFMQQYKEMSKSNGLDKATKDSHEFMIVLRDLGTTFENLAIRIEGALLTKIGPQLERFKRWFEKNSPAIADRIGDIASAVLAAAAAMGPPIAWLADKFIELDKATDGWSTKLLLAIGVFKILGGFQLISGIWKMVAALRAMAAASTAAAAAGGAAGGAGAAAGAAGGWLSRFLPWLGRVGGAAALMFHSGDLNEGETAELARRNAMPSPFAEGGQPASGSPSAGSNLPRGIRNNNPGNLNYVGQDGATREAGPGGRFAVFASAQQGLEALAIQIKRYANAGMNSIRAIIEKYAPKGENNTEAYIASLARKFGVSDTSKLDFSNKETLANMVGAITQFENGQNPYSRDMIVAAAAKGVDHTGKFGGGRVQIDQKTEINVYGASDSGAAAREVERRQRAVNEGMVRNMQGAIG